MTTLKATGKLVSYPFFRYVRCSLGIETRHRSTEDRVLVPGFIPQTHLLPQNQNIVKGRWPQHKDRQVGSCGPARETLTDTLLIEANCVCGERSGATSATCRRIFSALVWKDQCKTQIKVSGGWPRARHGTWLYSRSLGTIPRLPIFSVVLVKDQKLDSIL